MHTYFIVHSLNTSTVLSLNLPFLVDLCPQHQKCLVKGKRNIIQSLLGEGRKPACIEHVLCVRYLVISSVTSSQQQFLLIYEERDFERLRHLPKVRCIVRDGMKFVSKQPNRCGKMILPTFSLSYFLDYLCENYSYCISITFSHFQTYSVCNLDLLLSPVLTFLGVDSLYYFIRESSILFCLSDMNFLGKFKNHRTLSSNPSLYKN